MIKSVSSIVQSFTLQIIFYGQGLNKDQTPPKVTYDLDLVGGWYTHTHLTLSSNIFVVANKKDFMFVH